MADLTFAEFQAQALPLYTPDAGILLWAAGLGGEQSEAMDEIRALLTLYLAPEAGAAGRVQDIAKKIERGRIDERSAMTGLDERLVTECGDVLFYLRALLAARGHTLEDAARACLAKLEAARHG